MSFSQGSVVIQCQFYKVHYKKNFFLLCIYVINAWLLTQVVPDVHFTAQSSNLNDSLTEEIIRLSFELLLYSGLNIIILVPNAHFDPIGRVVTLTVDMFLYHHEHWKYVWDFKLDLKPLTNWSSHPIQGWGCRRWSWFVFWSCLLAP